VDPATGSPVYVDAVTGGAVTFDPATSVTTPASFNPTTGLPITATGTPVIPEGLTPLVDITTGAQAVDTASGLPVYINAATSGPVTFDPTAGSTAPVSFNTTTGLPITLSGTPVIPGGLTPLTDSTTGSQAVDPASSLPVYVVASTGGTVTFDPTTGAIAPVNFDPSTGLPINNNPPSVALPAGLTPLIDRITGSQAIDANSGLFVYQIAATGSTFTFDPTTGAVSPVNYNFINGQPIGLVPTLGRPLPAFEDRPPSVAGDGVDAPYFGRTGADAGAAGADAGAAGADAGAAGAGAGPEPSENGSRRGRPWRYHQGAESAGADAAPVQYATVQPKVRRVVVW
jgi:hypothetical protein